MEYDVNSILISSPEIVNIVRRSLSKIDSRLMEHGERVAYIATAILEFCPDRDKFDRKKLLELCLLHDIGAYKISELDDMLHFESDMPFQHALFGYLLLKNMAHLSDYAEALLYHHTDYEQLKDNPTPCARYAELIYLADRADIFMHTSSPDFSTLKNSGKRFNSVYIGALFAAQEKVHLADELMSGVYKEKVFDLIQSLNITGRDVMDYLELLVYAIDFRSPYTVTHTIDTAIISLETGKLLGLDNDTLQKLYLGAFLHDIGKIGISYQVLEKPSRLTPEEFSEAKRHINEGEEILRGVLSDEICDIALRHHEKLNGHGYPLGICAEDLTIPQRIVAVADILSALSQQRSYKPAYPKEKTISILKSMRDAGELCPMVVDTICKNYDDILESIGKSNDPLVHMYGDMLNEYEWRCKEMGIVSFSRN